MVARHGADGFTVPRATRILPWDGKGTGGSARGWGYPSLLGLLKERHCVDFSLAKKKIGADICLAGKLQMLFRGEWEFSSSYTELIKVAGIKSSGHVSCPRTKPFWERHRNSQNGEATTKRHGEAFLSELGLGLCPEARAFPHPPKVTVEVLIIQITASASFES